MDDVTAPSENGALEDGPFEDGPSGEAPLEAVDTSVLDAVEAEVDDIGRALARLEEGSYGTCEVCGDRISAQTLAERPAARHCPAHLPMTLA
jgi:DnaK suppressor protein